MTTTSSLSFDLLMFDLDGTLIETAPEIGDALNDTLKVFALPAVTQAKVKRWIGHGTRELLVQALAFVSQMTPENIRSSDTLDTITAEFDHHYQRR